MLLLDYCLEDGTWLCADKWSDRVKISKNMIWLFYEAAVSTLVGLCSFKKKIGTSA
jgi:hypothetical protein